MEGEVDYPSEEEVDAVRRTEIAMDWLSAYSRPPRRVDVKTPARQPGDGRGRFVNEKEVHFNANASYASADVRYVAIGKPVPVPIGETIGPIPAPQRAAADAEAIFPIFDGETAGGEANVDIVDPASDGDEIAAEDWDGYGEGWWAEEGGEEEEAAVDHVVDATPFSDEEMQSELLRELDLCPAPNSEPQAKKPRRGASCFLAGESACNSSLESPDRSLPAGSASSPPPQPEEADDSFAAWQTFIDGPSAPTPSSEPPLPSDEAPIFQRKAHNVYIARK